MSTSTSTRTLRLLSVPSADPPQPPAGLDPLPAHGGPTAGTVVRVSADFGHDPVNSTRFLQRAFDSDADIVVVDHVPGGWPTDGLVIRRDNLTVVFEPNVTIQARLGGFTGTQDRLLRIEYCSNVTLSGYGATLQMNKLDYRDGEWRNTVRLCSVSKATIEGLTLRDSGGDGIGLTGDVGRPCTDIVLRDLVCTNNRRNGLTLGNVDGVLVDGCAFVNTVGTAPQAGVDLAPDMPGQLLKGVRLVNCVIDNNASSGIQIETRFADRTSTVDVLVDRTTIGSQVGGSPQIMVYGDEGSPGGLFEVRDSLVRVAPGSGAVGTLRLPPSAHLARMTRLTVWNVGNPFVYNETFFAAARGLPSYGNLRLDSCVVVTDQPPTFLRARDPESALVNVTGEVTVFNRAGAETDLGTHRSNANVDVRCVVGDPELSQQVRVVATTPSVSAGETARFSFVRTGDATVSLAVAYEISGTARERHDYAGQGHVVTFGVAERCVEIEIVTYRRRDDRSTGRNMVLCITPGPLYWDGGGPAHCRIEESVPRSDPDV